MAANEAKNARGEPLRCPNDGARLVEIERSEVLIDACPECRGIWLDRGEIGPIDRFQTDAQLARTPASLRSKRVHASTSATGSTAAATASSTALFIESRSPRRVCIRPRAPTWSANRLRERAAAKRSAASNDNSPAPSSTP